MRWIALGWLALSGCVIPSGPRPDDDPIVSNGETEESCVIAASDGGDGGPGGILSIRTARDPFLAGTITAEGGEAGPAGTVNLGPSAVAGAAGPAGAIELLVDAGYAFDHDSVPRDSLIAIGVPGQSDILPEGGSIAVERMQIGPGATLALSRVPTWIVGELHIAAGARLVLRDVGTTMIALDGDGDFGAPGLAGGSVTLIAQRLVVDGTLDLSGNQGGGFGGHLIVRAEELLIGSEGAIRADGGHGVPGLDESDCL